MYTSPSIRNSFPCFHPEEWAFKFHFNLYLCFLLSHYPPLFLKSQNPKGSTPCASTSSLVHSNEEHGTTFSFTFSFNLPSTLSPPSLPMNQSLFTTISNSSTPSFHFLCFHFMGAGISARPEDKGGGCDLPPSSTPGLGDVPESCISSLLMNFDPPDICKLARVNSTFHRASLADFVWESKLPSSYKSILGKVVGDEENLEAMTKKEIYAKLCRPNRFDGGTREVWLDKCSGQVCLLISSKSLKITGIDDRRYWNYIPTEESRFQSIAYLQQMWWVEVLGEVEFEFPRGSYSLFFRLQLGKSSKRLGRRVYNVDQVHGWDIKPVRFQLSTSDGQHSLSECFLHGPGEWVHYHVGDFVVEKSEGPTKIKFSLAQIDCTHSKGGLCVDCAVICPNEFRQKLK